MSDYYTVVGLHQNTGEPFVASRRVESGGDAGAAVVKAVEAYKRAGNDIGDLVIVAAFQGKHENLMLPPAFPAVDVLD